MNLKQCLTTKWIETKEEQYLKAIRIECLHTQEELLLQFLVRGIPHNFEITVTWKKITTVLEFIFPTIFFFFKLHTKSIHHGRPVIFGLHQYSLSMVFAQNSPSSFPEIQISKCESAYHLISFHRLLILTLSCCLIAFLAPSRWSVWWLTTFQAILTVFCPNNLINSYSELSHFASNTNMLCLVALSLAGLARASWLPPNLLRC